MTLNYLQCQLVFFYEIQIGKGSFIKESWVNTNKMNIPNGIEDARF